MCSHKEFKEKFKRKSKTGNERLSVNDALDSHRAVFFSGFAVGHFLIQHKDPEGEKKESLDLPC